MFLNMIEPILKVYHVQVSNFRDVFVPYFIGERFPFEPLSMAFRALSHGHELFCPFLSDCGVVTVCDISQVFDNSIESNEIVARGLDEVFRDSYIL